ncbi:MAG: transcription regulator containing HTH protein [uncultured bacterium]|nr:MAG: transcription regulator containing HTH protein [uncultured bacterium]
MSTAALKINYVDQKTKHEFHLPISVFKKPSNVKEYSKLEKILDELIDEVRGNEKHPLTIAMQIIGENLEQYDNEHFPDIGDNISDVEMVKFLIESYHLRQADLADIFGGQANVSKFLNGERSLSKNQIARLKKRFGISADFFVK